MTFTRIYVKALVRCRIMAPLLSIVIIRARRMCKIVQDELLGLARKLEGLE